MPDRQAGISRHSLVRALQAALLASVAAGCSGDVIRFQDGFYTGQSDGLTTSSVADGQAAALGRSMSSAPADAPYGADGSNRDATSQPVTSADLGEPGLAPSLAPSVNSAPSASAGGQATFAAPPSSGASGAFAANGGRVTVARGDTLTGLARRHGVSVGAIMRANGLGDGSSIRAGQQLVIPAAGTNPVAAPQPEATPVRQVAALPSDAPKRIAAGGAYEVRSGDSLAKIARQTGISVAALKAANGLTDDTIRIGETLRIPGGEADRRPNAASAAPATAASTPSVAPALAEQRSGTDDRRPVATDRDVAVVAAEEDVAAATPQTTGIGKLRWPARGQVVEGFGAQSGSDRNDGIDISLPEGTPIKAAENGVVIYAGSGLKEYGNTVLVRHEDGLVTVYGHARDLSVKRGDKVSRGQLLAHSGMSGKAQRPKLHFEVRKDAKPVDPMLYLD